jgi:SAM-dependent methyltransferase
VTDDSQLREYYDRRAPEFDLIYQRDEPVRQAEQADIASTIRRMFVERRVLEVASGTAYWTAHIAEVAKHVVAVESSAEMIEQARKRKMRQSVVEFRRADAYRLDQVDGTFDGGVANFWISHVPLKRMPEFLSGFHSKLESGAAVLAVDSVYLPELSGELMHKDGEQDTFVNRRLTDGSRHVILKNYFTSDELRALFSPFANRLEIRIGECFWIVTYKRE